ncbi:hypothetical protein COU57_01925 [Candidatus Pacearchaeota archaeon CG10_big_fil_rev_8_21_14_0_10_32_14]|nr:MAG: hypothetical protein COU57_01925 [Candidatus Pacearchaeota archaeon CG10_big_fil_rev_8_21_14_0_10_32_14]
MKDNLIYLSHILESISHIENFSKNLTKKTFCNDRLRQSAIVRELEIIGEAVKNLSLDFRKNNSKIKWNLIAGLRDKLIHHYFGINLERVWNVIQYDLPVLKKQIGEINNEKKKVEKISKVKRK